jgi:hypothetical protein
MVCEILARPVPLVEDLPTSLLATTAAHVPARDAARPADGRIDCKGLDKSRPPGQPGLPGYGVVLKGGDWWQINLHYRKFLANVEKSIVNS